MKPLLNDPLVEFIGEIGDADKSEFLGNARALLFPDSVAGALRPGHDRVARVRNAGGCVELRVGS